MIDTYTKVPTEGASAAKTGKRIPEAMFRAWLVIVNQRVSVGCPSLFESLIVVGLALSSSREKGTPEAESGM
jgi:hypothetical protein